MGEGQRERETQNPKQGGAYLKKKKMHSFCKDLLSAYYGPDTPLGAEDDTDTNPGQAAANNYGKLVRCLMGVGAREEGKTGDKVRAILGCSFVPSANTE